MNKEFLKTQINSLHELFEDSGPDNSLESNINLSDLFRPRIPSSESIIDLSEEFAEPDDCPPNLRNMLKI